MSVLVRFQVEPPAALGFGDDRVGELPAAEAQRYVANPSVAEEIRLVRFTAGAMVLRGYYNRGEIAGVSPAQAAWLVEVGLAEAVSLAERDAEIARRREEERKRAAEEELIYLRALLSTVVDGQYYSAHNREIGGFSRVRGDELLGWRTREGLAFFEEVPLSEMQVIWADQESERQAQAARAEEPPVLVRFLISAAAAGSYYCQGEVAGFSKAKAAELLARRTLRGEPFCEPVEGQRDEASPPASA